MRVPRRKRANPGDDLLLEHFFHLVRYAWHEEGVRATELHTEARSGSHRVGKNVGPLREVGLLRVRLAHRAAVLLDPSPDGLERRLVAHELHTQSSGDGFGGHVVSRGA